MGWKRRTACMGSWGVVFIVACVTPASAQPRLTFNKDVAPILWNKCATCHRPGEIGPFSLLTYDDVKKRVTQIGVVTTRRLMPPWKPIGDANEFQDDRRLTEAELQTLHRWIADGATEGNPADLPPAPAWTEGWRLGKPDLVVSMPDAYNVRADGPDEFRTFVIPVPAMRARYVRAIEFRPGNPRVVHHANIGVDRTQTSRRIDLRDPQPGYAGSMATEARYPEGQLLGWTPGQVPHASPAGMEWRLDRGSDLVVQLHLQPTGKPERVQASVGFFFSDVAPTKTPVGLRLGSETIDISAGDSAYVISDRFMLPVDVDVIAVQPHAHNLARRMQATATLPDGVKRSLIEIDDWDFRWQDVYRFTRPVHLPKGSAIEMRYTYDNSSDNVRNPHRPPARVVWGQNTTDEMGDLWLQLAAATPADQQTLADAVRRKAHAEDLAAYTALLRREPANPLRHEAVAHIFLEDGRVDDAIEHYKRSLQLDSTSAQTRYNLGIALAAKGRRDEAIGQFEAALQIDPDYAQAHNNLGALLQLAGRADEALEHYRRAVLLRPDNVEAFANMGLLLSAQGHAAEAAHDLRKALELEPDHPQALAGLAWIRAVAADPALRDAREAVSLAERAVERTRRLDIASFDALAAAYASAGRFSDAIVAAQSGLDLATTRGLLDVAAQFRERLALYRQGRSFRMPQ